MNTEQQDILKQVVRETITSLFKNSLTYQDRFNVEAVIGVTVDEKDILLVSMNELVKKDHHVSTTVTRPLHHKDQDEAEAEWSPQRKRRKPGRPRKERTVTATKTTFPPPTDDSRHSSSGGLLLSCESDERTENNTVYDDDTVTVKTELVSSCEQEDYAMDLPHTSTSQSQFMGQGFDGHDIGECTYTGDNVEDEGGESSYHPDDSDLKLSANASVPLDHTEGDRGGKSDDDYDEGDEEAQAEESMESQKVSPPMRDQPHKPYTPEAMANAIAAVKAGLPKRQASRKFGVPRATLIAKVKRKVSEIRRLLLTDEEEQTIVDYILSMVSTGQTLTVNDVRQYAKSILDKNNRTVSVFKQNLPGQDWYRAFRVRHPEIVEPMKTVKKRQSPDDMFIEDRTLLPW